MAKRSIKKKERRDEQVLDQIEDILQNDPKKGVLLAPLLESLYALLDKLEEKARGYTEDTPQEVIFMDITRIEREICEVNEAIFMVTGIDMLGKLGDETVDQTRSLS